MTQTEAFEVQAGMIGTEHGQAAASWVFDGNSPRETYERVLAGIVDGDPEVLDSLPSSPLSGEWADSFSLRDLADELGMSQDDDSFDDAVRAYEDGFYVAVSHTVERTCLDYLKDDSGSL